MNEREMINGVQQRMTGRLVAPELLEPARPVGPAGDARGVRSTHTLCLNSAYGEVLASEEVSPAEFPDALRRFYNQAIERASAVVVVDGIAHTRNAFLEFVREFKDCEARTHRDDLH